MTGPDLVLSLLKTVRHFFPRLRQRLAALPDRRDRKRLHYPARFLVWEAVLMFVF